MYELSLRHPVGVAKINITACNSVGISLQRHGHGAYYRWSGPIQIYHFQAIFHSLLMDLDYMQ